MEKTLRTQSRSSWRRCRNAIVAAVALLCSATIRSTTAQILEPLLEFKVNSDSIIFRVATGGCTEKSDFSILAEPAGGQVHISLLRLNVDNCKGLFRQGVEIVFTRGELGLSPSDPIQVLNPVR